MSRGDPDETPGYDGPSKTQVKQQMLDLQALGPQLLELPPAQFAALPLDERLRTALEDLRRFKVHGARKRQEQYVGKLLRGLEPDDVQPLRDAVARMHETRVRDLRRLRDVERWRERLLTEAGAWTAWTQAHPAGDTPALKSLLDEARREQHSAAGRGRAYRELFGGLLDALRT